MPITAVLPHLGALLLLSLAHVPLALAQDSTRDAVVVVLDVSNSMWGQIGGQPKIDIARAALDELVAGWGSEVDLGLLAFGHRREGDCSDIELVQPIGPVDVLRFSQTVGGLTPTGKTPMTRAVRQAAEALRYQDRRATVILFSDGIETCNEDPCALAAELESSGVGFTAHVIGFDVDEGDRQLACLAESTGGLYLTAKDAPQLSRALGTVREVATEPGRGDRITLEAVLQDSDTPLREGVAWRVVSLVSEASIPINAGTARPELPLEAGPYLVEARRGASVARLEITAVAGTPATHRLVLDDTLAVVPPPAEPSVPEGSGPGLIVEREPNGSFGQPTAPPVDLAAERSMPSGGVSFGQAQRVELPASTTVELRPGQSSWVRFPVIAQGQLSVVLQPAPTVVDVSVRLWGSEQAAISVWQPVSQAPVVFDVARPADYILEVSGKNSETASLAMAVSFAPTHDVAEPNDGFASATPLTLGHRIFGTILPAGDADWFSAVVAEQGQVRLELTEPAAEIELMVRMWDREQAAQGWLPLNPDQPIVFDIAKPGTYRFELRDNGDDGRALTPYSVESAFAATGDGREPNDSFGTAVKVVPDEALVGAVFPAGDADWFMVELADQGRLSVLLTAEPAGVQPLLRLWNGEQRALSDWQPLRRDQPVNFDLSRGGRYLLELRDNNNDERSIEPYELAASFTPTTDRHEPNDSFGQPSPVTEADTHEGAILPRGDADWLAIDVPALGALEIALTQPVTDVQMLARLWSTDQRVLAGWDRLGAGKVTYDLPAAGRYLVELRDENDDNASPDAYKLALSFARADIAALAPPPGEGVFTGTMFPRGDGDYLQIAVTEAGSLRLSAESAPPEIQLVAQVWDAEQRLIAGWTSLLPGATLTVPLAGSGRYTLEFRDNNNDERSLTPYRVAVDWPGRELVLRQERSGEPPAQETPAPPTASGSAASTAAASAEPPVAEAAAETGWSIESDPVPTTGDEAVPPASTVQAAVAAEPPSPRGVAPRAMLHVQDGLGVFGPPRAGTVTWARTVRQDVPAVQATVRFADQDSTMIFTIFKNNDSTVPASHLLQVQFSGLIGPSPVKSLAPPVVTSTKNEPGESLAGVALPVTSEMFWIALPDSRRQLDTNMRLLLEGSRFDLPVLYEDGTRGLITFEKGDAGETLFGSVISAWSGG